MLRDELPRADVVVANIELAVVERLLDAHRHRVAVTSGYLASERPRARGWEHVERLELEGWAADVLASSTKLVPSMATFSVRFLGCKVSYADAQAVRERLLARRAHRRRRARATSRS